jgi:hypothetical protein
MLRNIDSLKTLFYRPLCQRAVMSRNQIHRIGMLIVGCGLGCFFQAGAVSFAQAAAQVIPTPYDEDGYSVTANLDPHSCLVVTSIDFTAMLKALPDLQAKGLVRSDVDAAHIKAHAWTTASTIALKLEPLFIVTIFDKRPNIASCKFGQAYIDFDGKMNIGYSFTMTRAVYNKQDWSAFTGTDLPNVVNDFTLGPTTAAHMNAETNLSD